MITIKKSISDDRNYKGGILDNNVKYILINDKNLTKSYVSVSINAGSYYNPKDYEGLAHFLEHMLFMGSHKYPIENYFMNKINEYGGVTNAYTSELKTTYFFNIYDNGLENIIDIFSRFFIDPLFNKDAIIRECNAVNNEHLKNINNDNNILYQLRLFLANKNSPVNTFPTGSLNTLNKIDIREQMIEFYNKYYTSDNISICIASSKSFEDLLLIINKTFINIPNKKKYDFVLLKPFYNENKKNIYFLKTFTNIYDIYYIWEIPFLIEYYNSKDFDIFQLLLLNQSENSLYYNLKKIGYLNYIYIEILEEGIFIIQLSLSKEGYNNLNYINTVLYSYINIISNMDINAYAKYYQKKKYINFNYNNKLDTESLCNILSENHFKYNTEDIFINDFLINNIKKTEEYTKLFKKYFINNDNIIIVSSTKFINDNLIYDKLREYNTCYGIVNKNDLIFNIKKLDNNISYFFDLNNKYLDITVEFNNIKNNDIPYLINKNQWYGNYSINNEPIILILLQLNNNEYFNTPKNYILTHMSINLINFLISTILYKPLDISYDVSFSTSSIYSSININIFALNDSSKLCLLINDLIDFLLNIDKHFNELSKLYINNLLIKFKENLKNINFLTPWEYNNILIMDDTYSSNYNNKILLKNLNTIIYDDIKNFIKNLLNNTIITSFIYGSINKDVINNLFNKLNKNFIIPYKSYPEIFLLSDNIVNHPNKKELSNFVAFYFNIGNFEPIIYLIMRLFINMYSDKYFDNLRTKKQLGYLVSMNYVLYRDQYYIYQKIQSTKPLNYIIKKMNNFNKKIIKDALSHFNNFNFENYISSLKEQINETANSVNDAYNKHLNEIISRNYLFNRKEILLNYIKYLNPIKLKLFIIKYLYKDNKVMRIVQGNLN